MVGECNLARLRQGELFRRLRRSRCSRRQDPDKERQPQPRGAAARDDSRVELTRLPMSAPPADFMMIVSCLSINPSVRVAARSKALGFNELDSHGQVFALCSVAAHGVAAAVRRRLLCHAWAEHRQSPFFLVRDVDRGRTTQPVAKITRVSDNTGLCGASEGTIIGDLDPESKGMGQSSTHPLCGPHVASKSRLNGGPV